MVQRRIVFASVVTALLAGAVLASCAPDSGDASTVSLTATQRQGSDEVAYSG